MSIYVDILYYQQRLIGDDMNSEMDMRLVIVSALLLAARLEKGHAPPFPYQTFSITYS